MPLLVDLVACYINWSVWNSMPCSFMYVLSKTFPVTDHLLKPFKQKTFNPFPQTNVYAADDSWKLYSLVLLVFVVIFFILFSSKTSAYDLSYVGKGLTLKPFPTFNKITEDNIYIIKKNLYKSKYYYWNNIKHCVKRKVCSYWIQKSSASKFICKWEWVNPFPHTTILKQTTLNIFCQKMKNLYNWMDNLWLKVDTLWQKVCSFWAISSFVAMFLKSHLPQRRQKASICGKELKIRCRKFGRTAVLNSTYILL